MERERRARLERLMGRLAAGETGAAFVLAHEFGGSIGAAVRAHLAELGVHDLDREDLDSLVIDVCAMLADLAAAWRPDGGAAPWQWAWHRVRQVVSGFVGQHTDALDDTLVDGAAPAAAPGDEPDLLRVLDGLSGEWPLLALVREALGLVASARDQAILLEVGVQQALGDPSPAVTVAAEFGLEPATVRQAVSRTRRRLQALAVEDERFAPLADLALAA